jgi:hypothetical protein
VSIAGAVGIPKCCLWPERWRCAILSNGPSYNSRRGLTNSAIDCRLPRPVTFVNSLRSNCMTTLAIEGRQRNVREEQFDVVREEWSEYQLAGGTTVRVKLSVQKIFRVLNDDGTPALNSNGDPYVVIRHVPQIVATEA